MLQVSELYQSQLPREFLETLPQVCPKCGEPTQITETLSMLSCSNKQCGAKVVQRAVMMLSELGIKNLGESKIQDFMDTYNQDSPYGVVAYVRSYPNPKYLTMGSKMSEEFTKGVVEQFEGKLKMPLWEYVRLGNLPKIKDSARKLLQNYDDLAKFYQDIEERGVTYIQELLGIQTVMDVYKGLTDIRFMTYLATKKVSNNTVQSTIITVFIQNYDTYEKTLQAMEEGVYTHDDVYLLGKWITAKEIQATFHPLLKEFVETNRKQKEVTSVKALDTFNTLLEHKQELLSYVRFFEIEKVKSDFINVCISTSVGAPYASKTDFEHTMKRTYGDKVQINFLKSVTQECDVLICGNVDMQTTKLTKARKMQEQGHRIQIYTGAEFDSYLSKRY